MEIRKRVRRPPLKTEERWDASKVAYGWAEYARAYGRMPGEAATLTQLIQVSYYVIWLEGEIEQLREELYNLTHEQRPPWWKFWA